MNEGTNYENGPAEQAIANIVEQQRTPEGAAITTRHERPIDKPHEDRMLFAPQHQLFAVFDGVGAVPHGDKAAETAKTSFAEAAPTIPPNSTAEEAANFLEQHTIDLSNNLAATTEHGYATVALGYFHQEPDGTRKYITVVVGDSRIYRKRSGQVVCLTIDNEMVDEPRTPQRELQTKLSAIATQQDLDESDPEVQAKFMERTPLEEAIGFEDITPVVDIHDVEDNDVYLHVTDGIVKNLTDQQVQAILLQHQDPAMATEALVSAAQKAARDRLRPQGSTDDITAIVVNTPHSEPTDQETPRAPRTIHENLNRAKTHAISQGELQKVHHPDSYLFQKQQRDSLIASVRIETEEDLNIFFSTQQIPEETATHYRNVFNNRTDIPADTKKIATVRFIRTPFDTVTPQVTFTHESH